MEGIGEEEDELKREELLEMDEGEEEKDKGMEIEEGDEG